MIVLIIILVLVVSVIGVTWVVGRRHAARRDQETTDDAAMHDLHARYLGDVEALTQAYLLQAPPDEEWLAGIRSKSAAPDDRRQAELPTPGRTLSFALLVARSCFLLPMGVVAFVAIVVAVAVVAAVAVAIQAIAHSSGWWAPLGAVMAVITLVPRVPFWIGSCYRRGLFKPGEGRDIKRRSW